MPLMQERRLSFSRGALYLPIDFDRRKSFCLFVDQKTAKSCRAPL
jgi:hypothetical protein